ncbi:MAG: hypothetical protein RL154_144, partial [Pseudomonadota bacterium]
LVLKILYNDDESISYEYVTSKPLEQIYTNSLERGFLFNNIASEPKLYQISGVNWLVDLYHNSFPGCLLADDMGLGKTYQLVVFFDYLLKLNPEKRILIVTPTILIDNWDKEIKRFVKNASNFKIKVLRGKDLSYRANQNSTINEFDVLKLLDVEQNPTIILTTYQTLTNYQVSFAKNSLWNFDCIVFDEAHNLKNPSSQQSQAARAIAGGIKFKALLTGTPIENELRDLWALFDIFDTSHFGTWKNFKKEFVDCKDDDLDSKLRNRASNYILRRLKTDNLPDLPNKIEKSRKVPLVSDEQGYLSILHSSEQALTRMRKLKAFCLHKSLVEDFEKLDDINLEHFAKTKELLKLLNEIKMQNEKVIIFVINRIVQDLLKHHLQNIFNLKISVINGGNNKSSYVENALANFKNHDGFSIIILSPIAAGVGLTITDANHVIHYERWWNASKEDQASDRAYRIGQKKDVFIYYLLAQVENKTSFDEALHELIAIKRKTAGFLIPAVNITESEIGKKIDVEFSIEDKLDSLDGYSFEDLILKLYISRGYDCYKTPKPEHGADIIAQKNDEKIAIQCKYSEKGKSKDKEAIWQLFSEADYYNPTLKLAITNCYFDTGAHNLASRHNIAIVERSLLIKDLIATNLVF